MSLSAMNMQSTSDNLLVSIENVEIENDEFKSIKKELFSQAKMSYNITYVQVNQNFRLKVALKNIFFNFFKFSNLNIFFLISQNFPILIFFIKGYLKKLVSSLKKRLFIVNVENMAFQYFLGDSAVSSNTNTFNESIFGHLKYLEKQKGQMRIDNIEGLILYKVNGISKWLEN